MSVSSVCSDGGGAGRRSVCPFWKHINRNCNFLACPWLIQEPRSLQGTHEGLRRSGCVCADETRMNFCVIFPTSKGRLKESCDYWELLTHSLIFPLTPFSYPVPLTHPTPLEKPGGSSQTCWLPTPLRVLEPDLHRQDAGFPVQGIVQSCSPLPRRKRGMDSGGVCSESLP